MPAAVSSPIEDRNAFHQSTFLRIPPEVRQLVYHHLFSAHTAYWPHVKKEDSTTTKPGPPGILLANRLCHHEAKPYFYSCSLFWIGTDQANPSLGPTRNEIQDKLGRHAKNIRYVSYFGGDSRFVFQVDAIFPNLNTFEMDLGEDFFHSDQTNFDRAMRYALRYGDWKYAIKNALDERFQPGMRDAIVRLRDLGSEGKRSFSCTLHWRMAYRFVDFRGEIDLDKWILRIRDPDGHSKKVYEIPQEKLLPAWCEGCLTLPAPPSVPAANS